MLYDLSPPLTEKYAVWPSDTPLKYKKCLDIQKGHSVNITAFEATSHLGSHVVCSQMTDSKSPSVGELDTSIFIGPCQVIELQLQPKELITLKHLPKHFEAPRILFKTQSATDFEVFNPNYPALEPSLFEFFFKKKIQLIGLDTPGVDFYTKCTQVLSQKEASRYKIPLLLNLWLARISPGIYELFAVPLKLMDSEASPVRAILRTLL